MAIELYNKNGHVCLMFSDLVDKDEDAVQCNQFLIASGDRLAIIDPGGNITYNQIFLEKQRRFSSMNLDYIIASHADPDIVASLNKWLVQTNCKLVVPELWSRFIPHFCSAGNTKGRVVNVPDGGMNIQLGQSEIKALPAHFLHSEGNFQFYDPISKILFSGDMGASMVPSSEAQEPVKDFSEHLPRMQGFHQRYMSSNKICRYWVNMVRQLDVEWIVPQHGSSFKGKAMVNQFLEWVENLECGVDLMTQDNYKAP